MWCATEHHISHLHEIPYVYHVVICCYMLFIIFHIPFVTCVAFIEETMSIDHMHLVVWFHVPLADSATLNTLKFL